MGSVRNLSLRYKIFTQRLLQHSTKCCAIVAPNTFHTLNVPPKWTTYQHATRFPIPKILFSTVPSPDMEPTKLSKWQQLKKMYKEYWYIAVPVHLVTSAVWFGGFYYVAASGFDIIYYLEHFGVSETLIKPFRDSSLGYFAVAYALYKVFTPLRYTVTLGGTTWAIKYLKKGGYIKPVPTKTEMKEIFDQKSGELKESLQETKKGLQERKRNLTDDLAHYRSEIKSLGKSKSKPTT